VSCRPHVRAAGQHGEPASRFAGAHAGSVNHSTGRNARGSRPNQIAHVAKLSRGPHRKDTNVDTTMKPENQQDFRREDVKVLAAATRGAIDRYFELFLDELDRINRSLLQAERWADRGGALPGTVLRYQRIAKLAYDTPSSCQRCDRCDRCRALQELSSWSLLGFEGPLVQLFDLMVGRSRDLDTALDQLESTFLELTCNGFLTEVIMAHAFARAGYAPGVRAKRSRGVDTRNVSSAALRKQVSRSVDPERRGRLKVLEGGRSKRRAPQRGSSKL